MARLPRRRGAAAVEFALTAPILIVLLGFLLDWGLWFEAQGAAAAAARECARTGAAAEAEVDPVAPAEARGTAALGAEAGLVQAATRGARPTVRATLSGSAPAALLTCTVSLPYRPPVGLVGGPVAPPVAAQAAVTLRREVQP
jgi:Flp pilus assembly protein TadG